ncbi:MAG TPA: aldo/keto reductase [Anaerolineales bacterium]|nr:aldo/keto reductase [Anaerolineales bacterium]
MKYETLHGLSIPKIGFGTAQLGGSRRPDRSKEDYYLASVRSALELGYTHVDTAERYAQGHAEELIGRAIRDLQIRRENLFITSKVLPTLWSYTKVMRACEGSLRRLGTDYLDLYLIHFPNPLASMKETFRALNQLLREGKVRHLGVSNFNLKQLKNAQRLSESPIFTNQVPYNIFFRAFARNGVLEYCQQNDILFTAYTPLKINMKGIRTNHVIQSIARAHETTPFQIALAWLVAQPRVITIPMSFNQGHQKENLEAADIELTQFEMDQLDRLA